MADTDPSKSRITHGAVLVLASLHEADASCREMWLRTSLSESSAYRWLDELAEIGILDTDVREGDGRPVTVYHLDDEELGAAAQVVVDRLGREEDIPAS